MEAELYSALTPIAWVVVAFVVVWMMERWIHRHLQGVALILTGNMNWSILIYAIILFPGVFLHEFSHWVTALLLGIRTGRFSVWPSLSPDGTIRLGYVEYYKDRSVGPIRETLVGVAPLIFGTTGILLIGYYVFDGTRLLETLLEGTPDAVSAALTQIYYTDDSLLWIYLLFAISNAMMPSPSDRRAWPAFFLILIAISVLVYLLGYETVLWQGLTGPIATVLGYLALAFTITIPVNLFFILLIWMIEVVSIRLRGRYIDYSR